ncbi:MAG: hypothetical protein CMB80_32555 [Flammeovirgaceae bacterium]|nr:hypothetical protein [Flammeovirgaceae bacterium]
MTEAQWLWYAYMVVEDQKDKHTYTLGMTEYLASFWNSEAVQKVKAMREAKEDQRFASDTEFERQIRDGDFKESNDLIKSIREADKNTNLLDNNEDRSRGARNTRMPKDMSRLFRITKDKIE